jgi:hypothetical protein
MQLEYSRNLLEKDFDIDWNPLKFIKTSPKRVKPWKLVYYKYKTLFKTAYILTKSLIRGWKQGRVDSKNLNIRQNTEKIG